MQQYARHLFIASAIAHCIDVIAPPVHAASICEVTFEINSAEALSLVDISADYSGVEGTFVGSLGAVDCSVLLADTSFMARDTCSPSDNYCYVGNERILSLVLARPEGIEGQTALVGCSFVAPAGRTPNAEAFSVQVRSANSLVTGDEPSTQPTVKISGIQCAS